MYEKFSFKIIIFLVSHTNISMRTFSFQKIVCLKIFKLPPGNRNLFLLYISVLFSSYNSSGIQAQSKIVSLKCEHMVNPLGVDKSTPRLSWQMTNKMSGSYQKAYKIIVGTDSLEIVRGHGDSWESKKDLSQDRLVSWQARIVAK